MKKFYFYLSLVIAFTLPITISFADDGKPASCIINGKLYQKPTSGTYHLCGCAKIVQDEKTYKVISDKFECSHDKFIVTQHQCFSAIYKHFDRAAAKALKYNKATGCLN